jgi:hypothetical protein
MDQDLVLQPPRPRLRKLNFDDASFILGLLNQPSFIQFIGDRGVRSVLDARDYILNGPLASYQKHGFGLYLVVHPSGFALHTSCPILTR